MNDAEAWLEALAEAAREEDVTIDPRWEQLATGQLSPAEEAELSELARQSPAAAAAYEAFRPLDESERCELEAVIMSELPWGSVPRLSITPSSPPIPF